MKNILCSIVIMSALCLSACTTNKTVVSNTANLSKYQYATIADVMGYGGSAALMNMEVEIYNALSATRLQVIGDKQVSSLSDVQRQALLIVRFSASQNDDESVVSINFVDYLTGVPVVSCRGAYGMGWTKNDDMRVAISNAVKQMKKLF